MNYHTNHKSKRRAGKMLPKRRRRYTTPLPYDLDMSMWKFVPTQPSPFLKAKP